jgi:hypothetical protein
VSKGKNTINPPEPVGAAKTDDLDTMPNASKPGKVVRSISLMKPHDTAKPLRPGQFLQTTLGPLLTLPSNQKRGTKRPANTVEKEPAKTQRITRAAARVGSDDETSGPVQHPGRKKAQSDPSVFDLSDSDDEVRAPVAKKDNGLPQGRFKAAPRGVYSRVSPHGFERRVCGRRIHEQINADLRFHILQRIRMSNS